jgi:phosphatidylglycerol:prolipoprotein diacylglycerol transferase
VDIGGARQDSERTAARHSRDRVVDVTVVAMQFPAWDPVLLDIPWLPIAIRWYGLMYVVGFVFAQFVLVRLARAGFLPVKPEVAPDIIFYCVFGVMLGGRTGYALFYDHDLLNPLEFVQVWKGGLAFHGGLMGVAIALWLFARRHQVGWGRLADACSLAVPLGILAVRFANFINGELFGRPCGKDTPFAMQFPTDPIALQRMGLAEGLSMRDRELGIQVAYGKRAFADVLPQLSQFDADGNPIPWDRIAPKLDWARVSGELVNGQPLVPYRHPSQLYEGLGEGLLVGILLWIVFRLTRQRPLGRGRYAAMFLLGYASVRWSLELVRQPDAQFKGGTVLLGMTMGQILSCGLVLFALAILFWPRRPGATATR